MASTRQGFRRHLHFPVCLKIILGVCMASIDAASGPMVALDCYHNNEPSPHYTWSLTALGGFSQFAGIVLNAGGDTMSIRTAFDSAALAPANMLIIVDPDTTTEAPSPKYLSAAEINAVDAWVQRGGVLMLLTNNAGNCELTQISTLGARFGIRFNADTYGTVYDLTPLPAHPFFTGCDTLYIKDICTLTLSSPATAVLTLGGRVIMATSARGAGTIFALGDPWLYNEYINSRDNFRSGTNVIQWLLSRVPSAAARRNPPSVSKSVLSKRIRRTDRFFPNGKKADPAISASGLLIRRVDNTTAKKELLLKSGSRQDE